jgi:predicted O-methyltransferase YrrM
MYSPFKLLTKFISYKLHASNAKGHGMHSPFVYDFIRNVLLDKRKFYAYEEIELCRKDLLKDKRVLHIEDFGAGSRLRKTNRRTVSEIAHSSLKPNKFSQLLFRIINYYHATHILELGTSLGITSSYLSAANKDAHVITMEGSGEIAALAKSNFEKLNLQNIQIITGNFDERLPEYLNTENRLDLVFIDGNHRLEPTIRYFEMLIPKTNEESILIFDDIHWSEEMEMAWKQIQEHPQVTVSIDLFFIGLVFFRKENKVKQHFQINF